MLEKNTPTWEVKNLYLGQEQIEELATFNQDLYLKNEKEVPKTLVSIDIYRTRIEDDSVHEEIKYLKDFLDEFKLRLKDNHMELADNGIFIKSVGIFPKLENVTTPTMNLWKDVFKKDTLYFSQSEINGVLNANHPFNTYFSKLRDEKIGLPTLPQWKIIENTMKYLKYIGYDTAYHRFGDCQPISILGAQRKKLTEICTSYYDHSVGSDYKKRFGLVDLFLPIVNLEGIKDLEIFKLFIDKEICPSFMYEKDFEIIVDLIKSDAVEYGDDKCWLYYKYEEKPIINNIAMNSENQATEDNILHYLRYSDERRSQRVIYEESMLKDHNLGHWDLTAPEFSAKKGTEVVLSEPIFARNPFFDIKKDATIGIDFGTKSTIVSKLENGNPVIVAVGSNNNSRDFENPTVLHLHDFETFNNQYQAKAGRPDTSWKDLSVSWVASDKLRNSNAKNFDAFLTTLKQWTAIKDAGQGLLRPRDEQGKIIDIQPYTELKDADFDPVEAYAYYIGLAINNLRDKAIYTHYLLSYPVNYEEDVIEKIIASFRKGLLKSLPSVLTQDSQFLENFKVEKYASEPAAYAITALETYEIAESYEEEGKPHYYGIFDFGGGTTDFNYGVWEMTEEDVADETGYDYIIKYLESLETNIWVVKIS